MASQKNILAHDANLINLTRIATCGVHKPEIRFMTQTLVLGSEKGGSRLSELADREGNSWRVTVRLVLAKF